jgi:hypothetical protein
MNISMATMAVELARRIKRVGPRLWRSFLPLTTISAFLDLNKKFFCVQNF